MGDRLPESEIVTLMAMLDEVLEKSLSILEEDAGAQRRSREAADDALSWGLSDTRDPTDYGPVAAELAPSGPYAGR